MKQVIKYYGDNIFAIDSFLTEEECNILIQHGEIRGFKESSPSGGGHGRTGREAARTSQFVVIDSDEISNDLWNKVETYIPNDLTHLDGDQFYVKDKKEWKPIGVNPHLRLYKYEVGERIPKHMDYRMARKVWRNGKRYQQMTFVTLLVYLNDSFEEGETGYWFNFDTGDIGTNRKRMCNFGNKCDSGDHDLLIKPKTGVALISDHCLFHEGLPPKKGRKYVLRTDIVYEKEMPVHPVILKTLTKKEMMDREEEWERIFETSCKNYAD